MELFAGFSHQINKTETFRFETKILSPLGKPTLANSAFFNIVQRGGGGVGGKPMLKNVFYYTKGLFGNIKLNERLFKGKNVSN